MFVSFSTTNNYYFKGQRIPYHYQSLSIKKATRIIINEKDLFVLENTQVEKYKHHVTFEHHQVDMWRSVCDTDPLHPITSVSDIVFDNCGYMYICCEFSRKIHRLSSKDANDRSVLTTCDAIPVSLAFDITDNKLLVGFEDANQIAGYTL